MTPSPEEYRNRIKRGLCAQCGSAPRKNRTTCKRCADRVKAKIDNRRRKGLCAACSRRATEGLVVCKIHRNNDAHRHKRKKISVLIHYGKGGKLMCCWRGCDVIDPDMLSLDHINDDGAEQKRKNGNDVYGYVTRKNFPEGFQTLCFNHQWKKRIVGLRREK